MYQKNTTTKINKSQYPFLLRQIPHLPEELHMAGKLPSDDNKFLCVVGSRLNSKYGHDACVKLISGLAGYPVVIVSGLALGIDSIAHEAALDAKLTTVSFPGSGLSYDALYPPSHKHLATKIVEAGGALLSPFKLDQPGAEWTFPTRNRLMAGMSHATLIIEAAKGSGTLITADYAGTFGRDILTVTGSIFDELSYGPHMLLRRGATPVASSADILQALGFPVIRTDGMNQALPNFAEMSLSPEQKTIVDYLKIEPLSSTDLISKTGFASSKFNAIVSELELLGIISEYNGRYKIA